ncbi:unnamed protein product [Nippostrongylus brasiliensis]|uniref:DM13 domain-containing protein n=1 Tax=Nippostrongylus brasiliensis TaxID=27835 RepID=A0A158QXG6_NIPBR|nr:unnamed protein product [Nippostrongylus brasiliensis]
MTPLFGVILQTLLSCSNTAELTTYYGVPLGTLKQPALGIRGEIYLADDHTIVLDKFTHKPQITGSLKRILKYGIPGAANSTFHEASPTPPAESATFAGIDESYEEIEYVEDEEETEEREESFNRLLPTLKQSIPLISLDDVDPPREEEVGPMTGTARSITSGPVRIFNCNTILVPDLHFDADREFPRTFFYVGVGNVTKPLQQSKARTIGYDFDEPLEKHSGDDVMIRLPQGVRTFDVDFLSIYNENERKSYGFVVLPSLLVPPCVDEM